jgi:hypothetical protein
MPKILFLSTEPITFKLLLSGQPELMKEQGWEVLLVSADGREIQQICRAEGVQHQVIPFLGRPYLFLVALKIDTKGKTGCDS